MTYPTKKLGEITKTIRGVTYKPKDILDKENGLACFRTKNIQKQLDESDIYYIDHSIVKNEEKLLQNGDLLISSANSLDLLGKCCLIENLGYKATLGGFISCFRPIKELIDYNYFYYYYNFNNTQKLVRSFSKKTTGIANLQIKDVENIEIPFPPLPTQKLIVQKLDSAFKNIDESIKITKKNIENIEELNKSSLDNVFKNKNNLGIINDTLDFLTDYHANGSYKTLKENVELKDNKDYALMVRATDLENNNFTDGVKYLSEYSYNYLTKTKVYGNEIIIPKIGSIGNVYFMPNLNRPVSLGMNIFMLKINKENSPKYIYYYLSSHIGHKLILENAQGAVTKTITKISVKNIKIPLPPLSKQKEIVLYLDEVFEKNKVIKEGYEKKLKDLEEMKQSILKKAFEGRLVKD